MMDRKYHRHIFKKVLMAEYIAGAIRMEWLLFHVNEMTVVELCEQLAVYMCVRVSVLFIAFLFQLKRIRKPT